MCRWRGGGRAPLQSAGGWPGSRSHISPRSSDIQTTRRLQASMPGLWEGNVTHLCYRDEFNATHESQWCGAKDICSSKGMLFPLVDEMTWHPWIRIAVYLVGDDRSVHCYAIYYHYHTRVRSPLQFHRSFHCRRHLHVRYREYHSLLRD